MLTVSLAMTLAAAMVTQASAAAPTPAGIEIEAPGPEGPLRGTLIRPASGKPVVVMIPGSGPTDRNGNNPTGIGAATYQLLAEGLAQRGIGSVRIDKRGLFGSKSAVRDGNAVTIEDYAHDAGVWVDATRERTGAKCVWLLGHSEGGLVALAAAQKVDHLCGLLLVAAPGRSMGVLLKEQLHANPANAPVLSDADHAIEELSAGRRVDVTKMEPALAPLFNPAVQGYLISAFALDPATLARGTRKPILILQGRRDIQVAVADAERLKQAQPRATLVLLPDTNHVLKQVSTDDMAANAATYAAADLPLAPDVVDTIARFVESH